MRYFFLPETDIANIKIYSLTFSEIFFGFANCCKSFFRKGNELEEILLYVYARK